MLLTEINPDEPDHAFAPCDLGMGYPEFGTVSIAELSGVSGPFDLKTKQHLSQQQGRRKSIADPRSLAPDGKRTERRQPDPGDDPRVRAGAGGG